ncbi:MAG TPA: hypothetical protein VGM51_02100 [Armatimonadota bacterium]|jgi:hypothetical protein
MFRALAKIVTVLALIGAWNVHAQTRIDAGDVLSGAISSPLQTNAYTLSAQAGDVITVRVCRTSGEMWPRLVVRDPASTTAYDVTQIPTVDLQCTTPISGLIRINVSDGFSGTATGEYAIYAQVNNRPGKSTAISAGQTLAAQAIAPGAFAAFSIPAQAGDVLVCRATQSTGNVWPLIRLHDPTGCLVDSASGTVTAEVSRTLSNTGMYTVLVGDGFNGTFPGTVSLFVQQTNRPGAVSAAAPGLTGFGSIDGPAVMRTFSIEAERGEVIFARMARSSGNVWPLIRLYDPNGVFLQQEGSSLTTELTRAVGTTGSYTLLVGDAFNGTYTGQYNLFTQTLTHPANAGELGVGARISDNIGAPGVMRTYTLTMPPSGPTTLALRMTRTGGSLWPMIRLYDAYGNKWAEAISTNSAMLTAVAQPSRAYTVLVGDGFNGTCTGDYDLTWNFTVPDIVIALRAAGGLSKTTTDDLTRLNRVTDAPSTSRIDYQDVVFLARAAWGL